MARIKFKADKDAESTGGGGGGNFAAAPRGIYWLQIVEASDGKRTKPDGGKYPNTPMTQFVLEIADDDDRGALGKRVWHNVTWIPRGTGEKANSGHGMAVHWLHATNMPFDGEFDFDEQDFLAQEHCMVRALLEVETYTKVGTDGKSYTNEKNAVREVYTEAHPEPTELPPPPVARAAKPAAAAVGGRKPLVKNEDGVVEEVPF